MKQLSSKQEAILSYLKEYLDRKDYPPSVREIQEACGISSTSVVDYNLRQLEKSGHIRRDRDVSRGIEVLDEASARRRVARVPLLGTIAAGSPIPVPTAESWVNDVEEMVPVPDSMLRGRDQVYALRVKGTSMIDALVNDGDVVLIQDQPGADNGEMVVAWLKDREETTLKKLYREADRIRLQPANSAMEPIYVDPEDLEVQGRVIGVLRDMG